MSISYGDVSPMPVHIIHDDTKDKRPDEIRTAHRTITLGPSQPYAQIAGFDPGRIAVALNTLDSPIVICGDISQASDANNLVTGSITNPNGRVINTATGEVRILGQDELWISSGTLTRVGVTIIRRI